MAGWFRKQPAGHAAAQPHKTREAVAQSIESLRAADQGISTHLHWLRQRAPLRPEEGLFGPQSMMWTVMREVVVPMGGLSAVLLQIAHPMIAAAGLHGSYLKEDFLTRMQRTFDKMNQVIFGDLATALKAAERVQKIHHRIGGHVPEEMSKWMGGERFQASETWLMFWVLATLIESSTNMFEAIVRPFQPGERERYYEDMKKFGVAMGIHYDAMPQTWADFRTYYDGELSGFMLEVTKPGLDLADFLLHSRKTWHTRGAAYLAIGMLPDRWRSAYGLKRPRLFRSVLAMLRMGLRVAPETTRFTLAYHQAKARIDRANSQRPAFSGLVAEIAGPMAPMGLKSVTQTLPNLRDLLDANR